eukprot:gnl/Trimastix_PCT/1904.p1 GENE.gnl/Trimastix_PCT/1904~~gnl/Trimastix_PCT/1904.p1  ORF type:complete len:545 (-),score=79.97 gnl/Trimastix_PCT/1904:151-1785(-)
MSLLTIPRVLLAKTLCYLPTYDLFVHIPRVSRLFWRLTRNTDVLRGHLFVQLGREHYHLIRSQNPEMPPLDLIKSSTFAPLGCMDSLFSANMVYWPYDPDDIEDIAQVDPSCPLWLPIRDYYRHDMTFLYKVFDRVTWENAFVLTGCREDYERALQIQPSVDWCAQLETMVISGEHFTADILYSWLALHRGLKHLYLGIMDHGCAQITNQYAPPLVPLLSLLPSLQTLRFTAGGMTPLEQPLYHASLQTLIVETSSLKQEWIHSLLAPHIELPRLRFLELWIGTAQYGADVDAPCLRRLLSQAHTKFPRLQHLGLCNVENANDILLLALSSPREMPVLQMLHVLDLSYSDIDVSEDDDRAVLFRLIDECPFLRGLRLAHVFLPPETQAELVAAMCRKWQAVTARTPPLDAEVVGGCQHVVEDLQPIPEAPFFVRVRGIPTPFKRPCYPPDERDFVEHPWRACQLITTPPWTAEPQFLATDCARLMNVHPQLPARVTRSRWGAMHFGIGRSDTVGHGVVAFLDLVHCGIRSRRRYHFRRYIAVVE